MRYTSKYEGKHRCPFYYAETAKAITCEGIEIAIKNSMVFDAEEAKYGYIEEHCLHNFPQNCPLYNAVWSKYN